MGDSASRPIVVAALIGLVGTLGAALIANWNNFAPAARVPQPVQETRPARPDAAPTPGALGSATPRDRPEKREAPDVPDIAGVWVDTGRPVNRSEISQEGRDFTFTRQGVLPDGQRFESRGSGRLKGTEVTARYTARYGSGVTSTGSCSGTASSNGMRMELTCEDSLLGTFTGSSSRLER